MGLRGPGAKPIKKTDKTDEKPKRRRLAWRKRGLTRAECVVAFIESLHITAGSHAGRKFKLRDWQREIIAGIYATDDDGVRQVRQALLAIPRKNGKTQLAAALALCHLAGPEAEQRGQVFSAAADRDQAALIFKEMCALIEGFDYLAERIVVRTHNKTLEDVETGSMYQAMSSDARKAHGLSPSFVVCDELAQWHGRELYDNLITGTGARSEPLVVTISTMSADPNSVMSELVAYGRGVLDKTIEDATFHATIYSADEKADPWDEETWFACNPALGDFRSLAEMRTAAAQAQRLPAREPSFRLLYLNQPVDAAARFLNGVDWRACVTDKADLLGKRCYLGLDLSSTTDLTALAAYFPDSGHVLSWFWCPGDNLEEAERRDHVPYQLWARQGLIEATPGRAIDKRFVVHRIGEIVADYDVACCAFDRWRVDEVQRLLTDEGIRLQMESWGQGFKDMSPALDALETLVLQGKLKHPAHPVMDWCISNTTTLSDPSGNRKPAKDRSTGRIDGLVALSMAVGIAARTPGKKRSVYAERGLLDLSA
jgi:phage terminase large subunit-like protein